MDSSGTKVIKYVEERAAAMGKQETGKGAEEEVLVPEVLRTSAARTSIFSHPHVYKSLLIPDT